MDDEVLQELVAAVAKRDLRENESIRRQALEQFRDWITKNSDIRNCRTDDVFLLRFLRKGKFSVPMAQQTFLRFAAFSENYQYFMKSSDFMDPKINIYTRNGYMYQTPFRTERGWQVLILQFPRFDPYSCEYIDHLRAQVITFMTVLENEATQVLGLVVVVNLAGCTAAHLTHIPITEMLACLKAMQHTFPLRNKGFHCINVSPLVKCVFDLIVSNQSSKMARRYFCHTKLEDLYKHIDRKLLPKEYGGDMSEREMIDLWYKELESKREMVVLSNKLCLVQLDDANLKTNMAALPGAFRKLDVD